MAKSQAANFKKILEGYVSAKTGYPLPNVHTFWHNQVHIQSWVEPWEMYLLRQTTQSFLFIISLWIVFMRNGLASSTRTLRFLQPTMHPSDTTKRTSLYHFILCYRQYTYTHQQMFINKKSFEFGYDALVSLLVGRNQHWTCSVLIWAYSSVLTRFYSCYPHHHQYRDRYHYLFSLFLLHIIPLKRLKTLRFSWTCNIRYLTLIKDNVRFKQTFPA